MKNVYEMLKIHTFALIKMIPSKFHGWGFTMNFQLHNYVYINYMKH